MNELKDKVALITGAGSGIGRAIATLFAKEGAKVVVVDLNEEKGGETVKLIERNGGNATFVKADVSRSSDAKNAASAAIGKYGKLDILCNNAGIPSFGSVVETKEEDWDRVIDINLKSVYLFSKHAVPKILENEEGGVIINIASVLGLVGSKGEAAYCASKGGIISLTRAMALDFAPQIRVNCICPGSVLTPMHERVMRSRGLKPGEASNVPLKKVVKPEEVAYAALYLASDKASCVTGSCLVIDGGWTAE